jgi:hypothetical protein
METQRGGWMLSDGNRMGGGVDSPSVSIFGTGSCGDASSVILYKLGRGNVRSRAEEA